MISRRNVLAMLGLAIVPKAEDCLERFSKNRQLITVEARPYGTTENKWLVAVTYHDGTGEFSIREGEYVRDVIETVVKECGGFPQV